MNKYDIAQRAQFDIIRYANCWEDADVLLQGLRPAAGSRILSIGSAGDNSFSLLSTDPELVVAVDISLPQLYLIELKKVAIRELSQHEFVAFSGFFPCKERLYVFDRLKNMLSKDALRFWESYRDVIRRGYIHGGKFERYFQFFSRRVLPFIHNNHQVDVLFLPKSEKDQLEFYEEQWNTWSWRLLFKFFFSRYVMGRFGRDPQFLKEVDVNVDDFIFQRAHQQLKSKYTQQNHMLYYALKGSFGDFLPHYARPENFDHIKNNLDRLVIKRGYAEEVLLSYTDFDAMNLSNIFEYMDADSFRKVSQQLICACKTRAKIAYWNLMVPRRISDVFQEYVLYQKDLSAALSYADKGFFYRQFIIDVVK
jgi:S-adenosylmethionine-diacylglycerol 3-amino-3-carboxypropyl transferase